MLWGAEERLAVLGPGKIALYEKEELHLSDLVGLREDVRWGWTGDLILRQSTRVERCGWGISCTVPSDRALPQGCGRNSNQRHNRPHWMAAELPVPT